MEMVETFEEMLGQTINKIWINEDNDTLIFETTGGGFCYQTEADCCNQVWFEHISLSPKLYGSYVMGVEDKGWNELSSPSAYEVLENAFYTITTSNGYIDMEVRNSNNGYYGGRVKFVDPLVWDRYNIRKDYMLSITEDF